MYETFEDQDPVARRRAAIAAEKARLARDRERRESRGRAAVSGFLRRKWSWLGVDGEAAVIAVQEILGELSRAAGVPGGAREVLQSALAGMPDSERLLPAVRAALEGLAPEAVLAQVRGLHEAGIPWFTERGDERCRVICSSAPGRLLLGGGSRAVAGGPAFSLFVAAATRGAVPVPTRCLPEVLSWAPLPVLDDLIDHGGLLSDDAPWKGRGKDEASYLRARLAPETVAAPEAAVLEWTEYLRREAVLTCGPRQRREPADVWDLLCDVVGEGDVTQINELDALLPRPQQIRLRNIRAGAVNGDWPRDVVADRGLWRLMAALWQPQQAVNPRLSEFHALVALNRAYDLLKAGRLDEAAAQAERFEKGDIGKAPDSGLRQEALTLRAYVAAVRGYLAEAESHALAATDWGEQAHVNLALVRSLKATPKNQREPTNPFIELGLDHGSFRWEKHCRELFRLAHGDNRRRSAINRAEARIRAADGQDPGFAVFFRVPLDPQRYMMPDVPPTTLVPPLAALARRTPAPSAAQLEHVRARAAVELLEELRTTPPRLDRHKA